MYGSCIQMLCKATCMVSNSQQAAAAAAPTAAL
jgi:hypothetical protein